MNIAPFIILSLCVAASIGGSWFFKKKLRQSRHQRNFKYFYSVKKKEETD